MIIGSGGTVTSVADQYCSKVTIDLIPIHGCFRRLFHKNHFKAAEMIELLRTVPLFASLKKKEINFLAEIVREVEYPANTVLFYEGDPGDRLYIIIDGATRSH